MKIWFSLLFLLAGLSSFSQTDAFRLKQFNLDEGKKEFNYSSLGVVYHFVSGADQQLFQANPAKYEPQYGGWCAYAMGHDGSKVEIDPETFKIINGKLFLFYNRFFNNTLKSWNQDESKLHTQADANWQKILQQ